MEEVYIVNAYRSAVSKAKKGKLALNAKEQTKNKKVKWKQKMQNGISEKENRCVS